MSEQQKTSVNDKYKSQNCRQFYREKYCPYGKRCHFRHEYRSFKKIHRHFYMAHLAAISLSHEDVLADSRQMPDGSEAAPFELHECASDCSFEILEKEIERRSSSNSDCSTDAALSSCDHDSAESCSSAASQRPRLAIFESIAASAEDASSAKPID